MSDCYFPINNNSFLRNDIIPLPELTAFIDECATKRQDPDRGRLTDEIKLVSANDGLWAIIIRFGLINDMRKWVSPDYTDTFIKSGKIEDNVKEGKNDITQEIQCGV